MSDMKKALRKQILALRGSLREEEVCRKSKAITERLIKLPQFNAASTVMCYLDFRNEVATLELIEHCIMVGKRVAVPAVVENHANSKEIEAFHIESIEEDLEKGTYGILEPMADKRRRINPFELDMVIVPGVVFDLCRNRIGYGAGFYDRYLQKVSPDCFKAGVAFDLQVVEKLSAEAHDIKLDLLITETRLI